MKKNTVNKMLFALIFTITTIACKKENEAPSSVTPPPITLEKPSLLATWDWIKAETSGISSETTTPASKGFNISLFLQKDSSFYVIKKASSTNEPDTMNSEKFKFVDFRLTPKPGGGSTSESGADEIPTQITFNTNPPSPIKIFNSFDTIAIYTKSVGLETIDTYIRKK